MQIELMVPLRKSALIWPAPQTDGDGRDQPGCCDGGFGQAPLPLG